MVLFGLNVTETYVYGVIGSIGVELAAALKGASDNDGSLPTKYHKPLFVILHVIFAFIAGTVPVAFGAVNMWSAIYFGASAPLIFDRAARGLEPPTPK
jgi:hypothetical protein